jgi:hypothetical protein
MYRKRGTTSTVVISVSDGNVAHGASASMMEITKAIGWIFP